MKIVFENTYARLPERFFVRQRPAQVPKPRLIAWNAGLAEELSMVFEENELASEGLAVQVCSGNVVPEGAEPLAQAYAGHQFGGFVPQLGDGRAILLGEVRGLNGKLRDVQLKGAGRTAFSRGGDGKFALGPAMREYLVSEAMHALGVPSTRALALVQTDEKVMRAEGLLPGAVLCRVASSHLRVGTMQYFAVRGDDEAVAELVKYALRRHYPGQDSSKEPALALLRFVSDSQAGLLAQWMGLGFIHGVMNTDNCTLSGETLDFGPCAFMDRFSPKCVFSAIDVHGRYAWANQPGICQWNMAQLAQSMLPLIAKNEDDAIQLAEEVLEDFGKRFSRCYQEVFQAKMGLPKPDEEWTKMTLSLLNQYEVDFTLFFTRLTRHAGGGPVDAVAELFGAPGIFEAWRQGWLERRGPELGNQEMCRVNPVLIPRNHRIEQAIQAGQRGDFSLFEELHLAWKTPYAENSAVQHFEAPPAAHEVVKQTFCGT